MAGTTVATLEYDPHTSRLLTAICYEFAGRRQDADREFQLAIKGLTDAETTSDEEAIEKEKRVKHYVKSFRKRAETLPPLPPYLSSLGGARRESECAESQLAWAQLIEAKVEITNSIGMKLRLIPPGEFRMGSTELKEKLTQLGFYFGTNNNTLDEQPQHRVRINKPFYTGVHEVTLGQFLVYYNEDRTEHKTDAEKDDEGGQGWDGNKFLERKDFVAWSTGWNSPVERFMNHPVVNVSPSDAEAFCQWLSNKEGKRYRLLTEAEWEYACRAGTVGLFHNGNSIESLTKIANVADNSAKAKFPWFKSVSADDGYAFTAPVGSFQSNAFGLYDMHGNVTEFCADRYDENAFANCGEVTSDPHQWDGDGRVCRGGNWRDSVAEARSSDRYWYGIHQRNARYGFRVALDP